MHSNIHSPGSSKKEKQISFRIDREWAKELEEWAKQEGEDSSVADLIRKLLRIDREWAKELEEWAKQEDISVADLVRKLMGISVKAYREVGSLHELRKKFGEEASPRDKSKSAKSG